MELFEALLVTRRNLRGVVLVALPQDPPVRDELLLAGDHPRQPRQPRLQEPDELVEVVEGDLGGLGQHEHRPQVAAGQRLPPASVLARRHREVRVGVGHEVVELGQLVDDDEGRAARHGRRGRAR